VLEEYLCLGYPLRTRVGPVVVACADRPELTRRYLLPLIAELETVSDTDPVFARMLALTSSQTFRESSNVRSVRWRPFDGAGPMAPFDGTGFAEGRL